MNFSSDTAAPAHPAVIEAIAAANDGPAPSYGADAWSQRARRAAADMFGTEVELWLTASGTAANALALSILCPPTASILCHEQAHIERDERGAAEFFTGGGKLALLPGEHGRIDPKALAARTAANRPDFVHETPTAVVSLTNLTEAGAAYTPDETAAIARLAHSGGLAVHLDGARLANALAGLGASPADLTWKAGVDVLSLGLTKTGAIGCEAIVLFGEARGRLRELQARAKRAGHTPSKMRFLAAQFLAMMQDGRWLDLARLANARALSLAALFTRHGGEIVHPVDGNEVFVRLTPTARGALRDSGAAFYDWTADVSRFVCSWSTTDGDLDEAARALASLRFKAAD